MEVVEGIRSRKSIRGFRPEPVPRDILKEILEIATRAPSAMNTQPWEITVVAGEVLDRIRRENVEMLESGVAPNPDVPHQAFEGVYRQRQVDLAVQIFQLMGIAREDRARRAEWMKRGFRFFDAPAAIVLSVDRSLKQWWELFDLGALAENICLAALEYGLGTCIEDQGVMYPDVVRKHAQIPDSKRVVICIPIGYPDRDFPANRLQSGRELVESVTTWRGFD
ncbi:MAG: nitroreductase [Chloroflexota bacterium]|nr:nitroreductase [Chloroflexota bacterium]